MIKAVEQFGKMVKVILHVLYLGLTIVLSWPEDGRSRPKHGQI